MATVTSQLTRLHDLEGAPTLVSIGGGQGPTTNTDIFIQGAQSGARRQSNTTLTGFWLSDTAANDLSADNVHVGMWIFHTHYAVLTAVQVWIGSSTTNYDVHIFPLTAYPDTGGWVRIWVDVSRTPDSTGGTGLNEASAQHFGIVQSIPAVGGNAQNLVMDAIDSTATGLLLTGTTGLWSDFSTADANSTNQYGVVRNINGVYFVRARLTLGSATSLVFSDTGFVIVFPDQPLVSDTFMGITIDLQNASTSVTWTNGVINSSGTKQGDLITSSTSGSFTATGMTFSRLRQITLTSACEVSASSFASCDKLTHSGAIISECSISASTTADGEAFIVTADPSNISDCSFTFSDGHAIEITSPGTYTFSGNLFTGFGATGSNDAAIYNNSGGSVTLNISGGGNTPTYRNGAGASTTINNNVSVTLTGLVNNTEVRVYAVNTTTELAGQEDVITGSFAFTLQAGTVVDIRIFNVQYETADILNYTVPSSDASIPIQQRFDRNYLNP